MLSIQAFTLAAVVVLVTAQGNRPQEPPQPMAPRSRTIREVFREFVKRNSVIAPKRDTNEKKSLKRFIDVVFDSNCGSFGCNNQQPQQFGSQGFGSQGMYNTKPQSDPYYDDEYYDDDDYYYYDDEYEDER